MVNLLNLKPFKCCNSYWLSPVKIADSLPESRHLIHSVDE